MPPKMAHTDTGSLSGVTNLAPPKTSVPKTEAELAGYDAGRGPLSVCVCVCVCGRRVSVRKKGRSYIKYKYRTVLLFSIEFIMQLILFILMSMFLFAETVSAASRAVCQTEPATVVEGGNAVLQCRLDPPLDLSAYTLDFKRVDNQLEVVYAYRDKRDYEDPQGPQYRGRTSLDHRALTRGVVALTISSVGLSDNSSYVCFVPKLKTWCVLHLIVEEKVTKTTVSSTTGPAVEEVTESDDLGKMSLSVHTLSSSLHEYKNTCHVTRRHMTHDGANREAGRAAVISIVVILFLLFLCALVVLVVRRRERLRRRSPDVADERGSDGR